jgi:hypothetical protein
MRAASDTRAPLTRDLAPGLTGTFVPNPRQIAAAPRHRQQVPRLVLDRLTHQQIDQLTDISRAILDGLDAS